MNDQMGYTTNKSNENVSFVRTCDNCKIEHDFIQSPLCLNCLQESNKPIAYRDPSKCKIHGLDFSKNCNECDRSYQFIVSNKATTHTGGYIFF